MRRLTAILLLALLAGPATAQAFRADDGYASVTSSVPLHSFTAESQRLTGRIDLADSTIDFFLDLETLDSGIGKRDKDMRRTLDTDEHPFAEFFGRLVTPFDPGSGAEQTARVTGTFTIHGVGREIEVQGTLQRTEAGLRVTAEWTLALDDYDIEPPSLLIVRVDPVQKLRIDALLTSESP